MLCPGEHEALVLRAVGHQFGRGGTWSGVCRTKLTVGWGRAGGSKQISREAALVSPSGGHHRGGTETEPRTVRRSCCQEVAGRAVVVGTRRSPGLDHGLRCL